MANDLFLKLTCTFKVGSVRRMQIFTFWDPTPFLVWVHTGGSKDQVRKCEMIAWCRENIGVEAWSHSGRDGDWQRGGMTTDGWELWGFKSEEYLDRFLQTWNPSRSWTERECYPSHRPREEWGKLDPPILVRIERMLKMQERRKANGFDVRTY